MINFSGPSELDKGALENKVVEKLASVLTMPKEEIDTSQPMINYGVDSLMAVDMVNWLHKNLQS